jgi:MSHA biogenesis protein MshJ
MSATLGNRPPTGRMAPLRQRLQAAQQAFNKRPTRERVLMIVVGCALALAAADALWLTPAFKAYQSAQAQHQQALASQEQLKQDIAQMAAALGGQQQARSAELESWRGRVREGELALRQHEDSLIGADQMMALLEQVLANHGQVRVRSMRSLDRIDLLANQATYPGDSPANPNPAPGPQAELEVKPAPEALARALRRHPAAVAAGPGAPTLYQHGVELVLEGSFNDLLAYVQALERLPQHVLWGGMSLRVQQHPMSQLSLRLYTISRQRHWMEI